MGKGYIFTTAQRRFTLVALLLIALLLAPGVGWGQTNGDYRTMATGNWSSSSVWQKYNNGWVNCAAGDYPGANAGAGKVTISNNITVTVLQMFQIV